MTSTRHQALIQRRGEVELPAAGSWDVHPASAVTTTSRRDRLRSTAVGGALELATPPESSTLHVEATLGQLPVRLVASAIDVSPDGHGFSRWRLVGTLDDETRSRPVQVELTYHGVRRRGDRAWAWFTGRAVTPAVRRRLRARRADVSLALDLLLAPSTAAMPAVADRPTPEVPAWSTPGRALRPAC